MTSPDLASDASDVSAPTSPSGDDLFARLRALVAGLAAARNTEQGVNGVVAALSDALCAQIRVERDFGGSTRPRPTAQTEPGLCAAVDLEAGGTRLGTLIVRREAPLRDPEAALVAAAADLVASALARDTYRQALERELMTSVRENADQRALIECIVDSLPVGLYVVDRHYRIHAWNHKRETGLQGVSRTDAIGRTIFEVLHRQPADLLKREFDEVFASGRLQQFNVESSAFGDMRSYRISKIPMRMGGDEVTHVITIGEDITDWKAAIDRTAQSEKLAALGQLAAGVMHEINNPLATIAACAESLSLQQELAIDEQPEVHRPTADDVPSAATSATSELLRIIDLEVQRCKRIVNGLLDFSRPKPATRETHDLNTVVEQGMFLIQHHPKFKRVRVELELERDPVPLIEGDDDQLVQVLLALVLNAMDASPEGGSVTVRTRTELEDGERVAQLEVADEGPGIPRSLQAKVFEPFFTTKPPGQGTGLGLAICYGIVSDHGGELSLVSAEGTGAVFRVSLPVVELRAHEDTAA